MPENDKQSIVHGVEHLEELRKNQLLAPIPESITGKARELLEDSRSGKELSKEDAEFLDNELQKLGLNRIHFS